MRSMTIKISSDTDIHLTIFQSLSTFKGLTTPLLVFLHYWGGSSNTWHKLTSYESPTSLSQSYPCIAIDLRGSGQSTGPPNASDYSMTSMASDVISVLTKLSTDSSTTHLFTNGIILVGHSMGAKVALASLNLATDALLDRFKGMVLVAPPPPTPLILPSDLSEQQRQAYDSSDSIKWTAENILSSKESLTKTDLDIIVGDSLRLSIPAKDGWISYGMKEDLSSDLKRAVLRPVAKGVKFSVLAGELDIVERKDCIEQEVVQTLRSNGFPVTFTVLEGRRHLIPLEDPVKISEAILAISKD